MKVENEGFLQKRVVVNRSYGTEGSNLYIKEGSQGVCTADIEEYDAFAVWFDEPVGVSGDGNNIHWVRFEPWTDRDNFSIVEEE